MMPQTVPNRPTNGAVEPVVAYNKLTKDMDRYAGRLDSFAGEFSAILSREMEEKD